MDDKVGGDEEEVTLCMSVDPVTPVRRPMPPVEGDSFKEPTCSIMSENTSVSPQQETGADEPQPLPGFLFEVDGIPLKMIYEVLLASSLEGMWHKWTLIHFPNSAVPAAIRESKANHFQGNLYIALLLLLCWLRRRSRSSRPVMIKRVPC